MLKFRFSISFCLFLSFIGCSLAPKKEVVLKFSNKCEKERIKFCSNVSPGNGAVSDCIRTHVKEISIECKKYFDESNKVFDDSFGVAMKACESDHERLCGNIKKKIF